MPAVMTARSNPETTAELLAHFEHCPVRLACAIAVFAEEGELALKAHDHLLASRCLDRITKLTGALIYLKRRAH